MAEAGDKKTKIVYVDRKRGIGLGAVLVLLLVWGGGGQWARSNLLARFGDTYLVSKLAAEHPIIARLVAPQPAVDAADRFKRAYEDLDNSNVLSAPFYLVPLLSANKELNEALGGATTPDAATKPEPVPAQTVQPRWEGSKPAGINFDPVAGLRGDKLYGWEPVDWVELYRIDVSIAAADFAGNDDHDGLGGGAPDLSLSIGGLAESVYLTQDAFSRSGKLPTPIALRLNAQGVRMSLFDRDAFAGEEVLSINGVTPNTTSARSANGSTIEFYWRSRAPMRGLRITSLVAGSQSEAAGLKAGDVIVGYGGDAVNGVSEMDKLKSRHEKRANIPLRYWRNGVYATVLVRPGQVGFHSEDVR